MNYQKEMQHEFENELSIIKAGLNSSKNIVFIIIDENYNYIYFNKAHEKEMLKVYDIQVKKGMSILDFILTDDDKKIQKKHYDLALNGVTSNNIEKYGFNKDIYFETQYNPLLVDNKIIGVSIISENVTLRENENTRKSQNAIKYEKVLYSMPQAYVYAEVVFNEEGKPIDYVILDTNSHYEELFSLAKDDILEKRIMEINPEIEDYWIKNLCQVAITGVPGHYENYSSKIDKYLSTFIYSPEYGKFIALTIDVSEDYKSSQPLLNEIIQVGSLVFNFINHTLSCDLETVSLNILESRLLFLLIRKLGVILSYEALMEEFEYETIDGLKEHIKVYVHRLRRKLVMIGCNEVLIEGHYGKGYSLVISK